MRLRSLLRFVALVALEQSRRAAAASMLSLSYGLMSAAAAMQSTAAVLHWPWLQIRFYGAAKTLYRGTAKSAALSTVVSQAFARAMTAVAGGGAPADAAPLLPRVSGPRPDTGPRAITAARSLPALNVRRKT